MAIPKIIHQVWEGRTEPCMPTRLQILARTWREQNPDWEYHLWNGEEMDELVEKHFPEYLSMYRSFPYNVQRWDTIRYMTNVSLHRGFFIIVLDLRLTKFG
ncbi:glycosyltransferase family 32 protein [Parabacteroides distasonis]|uniref:glycosyltransferase family 32 protein n=1 Tax=Parabacteroides distasonis TaxID=823 RepID=UPI0039B67C00